MILVKDRGAYCFGTPCTCIVTMCIEISNGTFC